MLCCTPTSSSESSNGNPQSLFKEKWGTAEVPTYNQLPCHLLAPVMPPVWCQRRRPITKRRPFSLIALYYRLHSNTVELC